MKGQNCRQGREKKRSVFDKSKEGWRGADLWHLLRTDAMTGIFYLFNLFLFEFFTKNKSGEREREKEVYEEEGARSAAPAKKKGQRKPKTKAWYFSI